MDKVKTSKKRGKSSPKSNEVKLTRWSPTEMLASKKFLTEQISEALANDDKQAIIDAISAFVRSRNILKLSKEMDVPRSTIYQAIKKDSNPSIDLILKILRSA